MGVDVAVLRVFTDAAGNFGNPLGVVDASTVEPQDRQRLANQLGYSETIFVDLPVSGTASAHATIHTPRTQIPFAGHPTVGLAWWLRENDMPIKTLQVPAGIVQVSYQVGRSGDLTAINARAEWAPEFTIHDLDSLDALASAEPDDFPDNAAHYLWAWTDRAADSLRARMLSANLRCARRRSDRLRCHSDDGLPEPRPHHHPGQGVDDRNHLEPGRLGHSRRPSRQ